MRIALVHDDLVQWGGAERTFYHLSLVFPEADIFTSVYNKSNPLLNQFFSDKKIITSFIQQIPGWKMLYKILLPFYPIAFEQFDFSDYDLVISSTTRFAKSIITKPETKHFCYCHTPPRFLSYLVKKEPLFIRPYFKWLKRYDLVSSKRVDKWVAGSKNAQVKIKDIYGLDSQVIYPCVDLERFKGVETFDGGYLLIISRLNKYKRVDLAVNLSNETGVPLKIVGVGPEMDHLRMLVGPQVSLLGSIDENLVVELLAGCKALIVCAEEDFGLTPLEAQALGKPVLAFKKGGVLETVTEGKTGYLFDTQTIISLKQSLEQLDNRGYNKVSCINQAEKFSFSRFRSDYCELVNK